MTWLWISLIVIGAAMILAAFWPNLRGRKESGRKEDSTNGDGVSE
jgi:hypothetical protein